MKSYPIGMAVIALFCTLCFNSSFGAASFGSGGALKSVGRNSTATLLQNGKILLAGGVNGQPVSSAELYDPSSATSVTIGSMKTNRTYHTATLLPNGKVLVAGGSCVCYVVNSGFREALGLST